MINKSILVSLTLLISSLTWAVDPTPVPEDKTDRGLIAEKTTLDQLTTIVGKWKTIDDKTGKEKSIVEITENNGEFVGHVVQTFRPPTEDQNPKCDKCKGDLKDKPIIGLQILSKLKKKNNNQWADGEILDPNNGKTYSCKMELIENGKKLNVRGFLGFSLLGRTQTWIRAE